MIPRPGLAGPFAVAAALAAAPATAPAQGDRPAVTPVPTVGPVELAQSIPGRLRTELFREPVDVRVASASGRRDAAGRWVAEALAPLRTPACRRVLGGLVEKTTGFADLWPEDDPIARASGPVELLVPEALPALTPADVESFETRGILPFEIMLAGEWARAVARRHAGPPPADPLLRQARAARLEGVARLAGIALTVQASGLSLAELGQQVLSADADEAGWPRAALARGAHDPVTRAALRVFAEDGLRWAAFHFLRGGVDELIAAIERPGVGPADLLGPGRGSRVDPLPGTGCRLGPRPAAALLVGDDDPLWVDEMHDDVWTVRDDGGAAGRLRFSTGSAARAAADDARNHGWRVGIEGLVLTVERPRSSGD